jgi:agmatinase
VITAEEGRIFPFFDSDLKRQRFQGVTWEKICAAIVDTLPERIYISFDIDGLDAKLCPSTGTPVPGGLEFDEVCYLFEQIVKAGKKIVGFDLCEVAPGENMDWDAQVGSRILYKLAMMIGSGWGKIPC